MTITLKNAEDIEAFCVALARAATNKDVAIDLGLVAKDAGLKEDENDKS